MSENPSSQSIEQSAVRDVHAGGDITIGKITQIIYQQVEEDKPIDIPWQDVCRLMLEEKRHLTSNKLFHDDEETKFQQEQLFVPLALVERKKPNKLGKPEESRDEFFRKKPEESRDEFSPEEGAKLYEPQYEEKQRFEHEKFLQGILKQGEGKTKGRRIALIGEPGAGKTTLLQDIAFWVLKQNLGLPIWIPLADLAKSETLTDLWSYLKETWLTKAIPVAKQKAVEKVQENFMHQVEQGQVWLLLDGVDEAVTTSGAKTLQAISQSLTGWIGKVRVVLTCRLNIWEGNVNALSDFETYRLLDFEYPQQVHQFIDNWFARDTGKGNRLKVELDKEERIRIRDLVQNPLRLTLLCQIWQSEEGQLPDTKAGLYAQFVQQFYTWKSDRFDISRQDDLSQALGCLAIKDIDSSGGRFRLRKSFITEELGNPDDNNSLCYLALKLGWLNYIGEAAESPQEKVYAFFHATFEEYFAACAIDNWDFFLPRRHKNKPIPNKRYRIFEPQWKQVILLWIGRENIDKEQKQQFINALTEFKDGCGSFYWRKKFTRGFYEYRAYFLAVGGIAEFHDCAKADKVASQIVEWSHLRDPMIHQLSPIEEAARATLLETKGSKAIKALIELLYSSDEDDIRRQATESLGKIGLGNEQAIKALIELLYSSHENYIRWQATRSLGQIGVGNEQAIKALIELLNSSQDESSRGLAATSLGKIGVGNEQAIKALIELLNSSQDQYSREEAGKSLRQILRDQKMAKVVGSLKRCVSPISYKWSRSRFEACYEPIWDCAQTMDYPDFYHAWHQPCIKFRFKKHGWGFLLLCFFVGLAIVLLFHFI